ncbi:MAG: hypothetical protein KDC38_14275, partial [Planctomycetes bacterium]|nr:hypothetical protein [Planctomycetota bacterium]
LSAIYGDYYLDPSSPAIDAGDPSGIPYPGTTLASDLPDIGTPDLGFHFPFASATQFRRGDVNDDDAIDISDAVSLLSSLFVPGTTPPGCDHAADINDDSGVDIADAIYLLAHLFTLGPAPTAPFTTCGADPTDPAALGCSEYQSCP